MQRNKRKKARLSWNTDLCYTKKKPILFCLGKGEQTVGKPQAEVSTVLWTTRPWWVKGPKILASTVHDMKSKAKVG